MALKQDGMHFVLCPKQGNKIEGVVLNRVRIIEIFSSKQGQGFITSAAHLYPNIGRVTPPPSREGGPRLIYLLSHDVSRIEEKTITLLVFYDCFCVRLRCCNSFTEPSRAVGASLFR